MKKQVAELKKSNYHQSNLTSEERLKLRYLSKNCNLTIKGADKGAKIVIMNMEGYTEYCELILNDREFYGKLDANPALINAEDVKQKFDEMLKINCITEEEFNYLAEKLESPKALLFYRLPKIHKIFDSFPLLQPITSGFNFGTCNLPKFVDSFLKFQDQKSKSYIRNTKNFLIKLSSIKHFPENSFQLWTFHLFTLTFIT